MPPRRKPSRVLDARGSFRKNPDRRRVDPEPDPVIGAPLDYLAPDEAAIWREISAACPPGWLCVTDRGAFARYCELVAKQRTRTLQGEDVRQLASLEGRFGFAPTERSKITTVMAKETTAESALARVLSLRKKAESAKH